VEDLSNYGRLVQEERCATLGFPRLVRRRSAGAQRASHHGGSERYSLWTRGLRRCAGCLPVTGIGFVPYSPLGRGVLTARSTTSIDLAQMIQENEPRFEEPISKRTGISPSAFRKGQSEKRITAGQLALLGSWPRVNTSCPSSDKRRT